MITVFRLVKAEVFTTETEEEFIRLELAEGAIDEPGVGVVLFDSDLIPNFNLMRITQHSFNARPSVPIEVLVNGRVMRLVSLRYVNLKPFPPITGSSIQGTTAYLAAIIRAAANQRLAIIMVVAWE